MALRINKQENVYVLSGSLKADQVFELGRFFNLKLHEEQQMFISLAGLDVLDASATLMFKQILFQAKRFNKECAIYGTKDCEILGGTKSSYMTDALAA